MKLKRSTVFITISSIVLLLVLVMQVLWLIQTARDKENFFNEKVGIIRARSTEAISSDTVLSKKLLTGMGKNETKQIDSIIRSNMKFYGFREEYTFRVVNSAPVNPVKLNNGKIDLNGLDQNQQACNSITLDSLNQQNGWELILLFPDKKRFIISEMGFPFFSTFVLIIIVIIFFWRTVSMLMKEKKISEHATDFLNNMTHEFKTPLTNISLAGKMLVKDPERVKHYSGIILEENEKLRLQVEQVLSMTALERGEIPVCKTELDFHQLIRDAFKSMSIQIENAEGKVHLELSAPQFVVMGDKTHLTNAFCNLIDNAIKYSKGKPDISVKTSNDDQNLVIEFKDQGIGIDKEYHKKVFDKFFRVPKGNLHDVKGFGLGLAYIKKIIELHEGTIELQSDPGKGTKWIIVLPYD